MARLRQVGAKAAGEELQGLGADEFSNRLMSLTLMFYDAYRADVPNFAEFTGLLDELDRRMRDPQLRSQLDLSTVAGYLTAAHDSVGGEISRLRPQAEGSSDVRERLGYIEPLMATLEFMVQRVKLAQQPAVAEQIAAAAAPEAMELAGEAPEREPAPIPIINQGYLTFVSGMTPSQIGELATHLLRLFPDENMRQDMITKFMNGLLADDMGYANKAEFGRMIIADFAQGFGMSADHFMDFANWTDSEKASIMERLGISDLAFIQQILSLINSGNVRDALQQSQGHGTLGNTLAELNASGLSMLGVRVEAAQFRMGANMQVYENEMVSIGFDAFLQLGLIQNMRIQGDYDEATGNFSNLRLVPNESNRYDMDVGGGGGAFASVRLWNDQSRVKFSVQGNYSEYHGPEIRGRVQFSDNSGDIADGLYFPSLLYGEVTASGPNLGNVDVGVGTQAAVGIFSTEAGCFFVLGSVDWLKSVASETIRSPMDATNVGLGAMWVGKDYAIQGNFFYDVQHAIQHPGEGQQMGAMVYGNFAAGENVNVGVGMQWNTTVEPYTGQQVNRFMVLGGVNFDLYGLIFGPRGE